MRKMKLLMLPLGAAAMLQLTGCASWLNIGEENFSCSGMPDDVRCMSAEEMYEYSLKNPPSSSSGLASTGSSSSVQFEADSNEDCENCGKGGIIEHKPGQDVIVTNGKVFVGDDEIVQNFVTPRLPDSPVPVRSPAVVMRIWVAPYEDLNGDLNSPGYVYTEIEARRWITPSTQNGQTAHFTPLIKSPSEGK
jgi:conjugal transfer pilus assembly protein TraV